jgi:hypothetical protein
MKASQIITLLGFLGAAAAQDVDPGPSPTASVGCEPHGDHWHCEGPRTDAPAAPVETVDPGPSPSASVGCEPHGDHWYV